MEFIASKAKAGIAVLLSLLLSVSLMPNVALAEPESDASGGTSWRDSIDAMLEGGSYVDGEALAVVAGNATTYASADSSDSVLDGYEPLAQTSMTTYEQTAEANSVQTYSSDARTNSGDSEVDIVLVHRDGTSTKSLLDQLARDPQVLYAEPNYTKKVSANEETSLQAAESASAKPSGTASEEKQDAAAEEEQGASADTGASEPSEQPSSSDTATGSEEQEKTSVTPVAPADKSDATMLPKEETPDLTPYQWSFDSSDITNVFTGQRLQDYDVNVPGWNDSSSANAAGVVALLDTGVDYNNPDLNGVMMDMTPYVSTIGGGKYGLNACATDMQDETDPLDDYGHGTHVAGIIASEWNGHGTSGAANGVKLLPVKVGMAGSISYDAAIKGAQYLCNAIDAGVDIRVVNNSWGGESSSFAFLLMVNALGERGCVSVCASGNDTVDLDTTVRTPTGTSVSPYSIIVDASGPDASKTIYTNWGQDTTDLYAPGSGILSTYPFIRGVGGAQGNNILGTYMPSVLADAQAAGNVVYDTFDGNGAVEAYVGYGSDAIKPENRISQTSDSVHFDGKGSLAISGAQLRAGDQGEQDGGQAKHSYAVTLKIPVSQSDLESATNFAFSTLSNTGNYQVVATSAELTDSKGTSANMVRDQWQTIRACPTLGWSQKSVDLSDVESWGGDDSKFAYHSEEDGTGYIVMSVMYLTTTDYRPSDNEYVYLDCVGLGNRTVPYAYMNGTSMASPLVAGASAVASTRIDASLSPSECALELVSLINGCTTQRSEYEGTCKSNGYLDLSRLDDPDARQPLINTVTVEGSGDASALNIQGVSFGDGSGAVSIDGMAASVREWNSNEVKVARPDGLMSGRHTVELTTAAGKTCSKTCTIEFSDIQGDIPLYEKEISLEGATFASNAKNCKMEAEGSRLFVFPAQRNSEDVISQDTPYHECWVYDIDAETWSKLGDLPVAAGTMSVANHNGNIYALMRTGDSSLQMQYLYELDTQSDTWSEVSMGSDAIPLGAALVDVNGVLLSVGGGKVEEGVSDTEISDTENTIRRINVDAGTAEAIGSLAIPRSLSSDKTSCDLKVAAAGSTVYVAGGCNFKQDSTADNNLDMEAFTFNGEGQQTSQIVSNILPAEKQVFNGRYGLAADSQSAYVAGYKSDDENDTFAISQNGATGLNKRLSYSALGWPSALVHNGVLYATGIDELAGGAFVMRATTLPASPEPSPSPEPTPTPGSGSDVQSGDNAAGDSSSATVSPQTGDSPVPVLIALGALLAAIAFRKMGQSRISH